MTVTFSQLIARTTEAAVYSTLRTAGLLVELDFDALPPNDLMRTLIKSVVARGFYIVCGEIIPSIARSGFLDFAEDGPYVDALGEQVYGVERIRETFATTTVLFTNTSDNPYTFAAKKIRVKNATTGKSYDAAAFSIGAVGEPNSANVPVSVIAVEAGSASNADVGQISLITTNQDGLTVTNPQPARANDRERLSDYIRRCKAAPVAVSPYGPKGAYLLWAQSATRPDGTAIGVTKVQVSEDDPVMPVLVYLADDDGPITVDDAAIVNDVLIKNVVGHGVDYGGAAPADGVMVNVTYIATVTTTEGVTADDVRDAAEEALSELFAEWPIGGLGGALYQSKIRSTIQQAMATETSKGPIVDVQIVLPASNVSLDPDQVATLGTVSGTIGFI